MARNVATVAQLTSDATALDKLANASGTPYDVAIQAPRPMSWEALDPQRRFARGRDHGDERQRDPERGRGFNAPTSRKRARARA